MAYEIFQYRPQGQPGAIILRGTGEHEGTSARLEPHEIHGFSDRATLASFLDRRFLLAHADRGLTEDSRKEITTHEFNRSLGGKAPDTPRS